MSETDKSAMNTPMNGDSETELTAKTAESEQSFMPAPERRVDSAIPEHIGEKRVCTIDTLIQKILDGEKQYDLSKIVSAYELAEKYHHDQKRESGKGL